MTRKASNDKTLKNSTESLTFKQVVFSQNSFSSRTIRLNILRHKSFKIRDNFQTKSCDAYDIRGLFKFEGNYLKRGSENIHPLHKMGNKFTDLIA